MSSLGCFPNINDFEESSQVSGSSYQSQEDNPLEGASNRGLNMRDFNYKEKVTVRDCNAWDPLHLLRSPAVNPRLERIKTDLSSGLLKSPQDQIFSIRDPQHQAALRMSLEL